MNCDECMEKLSLYIDQMLTEEEMKAMMAHLNLCETCREEYETLNQIIGVLKESKEVVVPEGFHETLMAHIKEEHKVPPIRTKRFKWGYPAGLVATLLIGFIVFEGQFTGSKSNESQAPMATYSMPKEEMARSIPEEATSGKAETSVASDKMDATAPEQQNLLESAAINSESEQVIWEATITNKEVFLEVVKGYLKEQQLTFTEAEGYLLITTSGENTAFWEWMEQQKEVKQLTITHPTGSQLKLIYHE